ncbi:TPA: ComEC/Rec2 family competence protein [Photobacterium damselae]
MEDFYEIDFLNVQSKKSGDAIPLRYCIGGTTRIHVTDGGFQDTGYTVIEHINKYYGNPVYIDAVIVTHADGDHSGGLRKLFEIYEVGELWMARPWLYANELLERFARFTTVDGLTKRLREVYPNLVALEDLAIKHGVPIREPFQGAKIGAFHVLSPSKAFYLDLVVESDKTPHAAKTESFADAEKNFVIKVKNFIKSTWGAETFPPEDTSSDNNMSVVQYAELCGEKVLLTGDAGRAALNDAAEFAPCIGLILPGIDKIQVPHHGSRRNVSSELLDKWLGPKLATKPEKGHFSAVISASKDDDDHPRKSVIRAFTHRGAQVLTTEYANKRVSRNAPAREGWIPATAVPYPEEQEK